MAAAVQASYSSNNAWDSTIVPTLRKRLENESRMLENRLSGGGASGRQSEEEFPSTAQSSTSHNRPAHYYPPSTSQTTSEAASSRRHPPRPSVTTTTSSSRNVVSPVENQIRPHTSMNTSNPGGGQQHQHQQSPSKRSGSSSRNGFTRSRTHSTPYAYDRDGDATTTQATHGRKTPTGTGTGAGLTGMPTPVSSRANSPMIGHANGKATNNNNNLPPSKIPMAMRKQRVRSSSNAASSESQAARNATPVGNGARKPPATAGGAYAGKRSTGAETVHQAVMFPPSPETSPELWLDRPDPPVEQPDPSRELKLPPNGVMDKIADELAPFAQNRISRASFEEREFEHWYRGEGRDGGGRNGGKGEIKVAKADTTKEMLDIALGGHQLQGRDRWAPRKQSHQHSDSLSRRQPELDQDYVMDEQALTDMEGDMTDYAPEPAAIEDLDDYYYTPIDEPERSSTPSPPPPPQPATRSELKPPSQPGSRAPSRASQAPSHKSQAPSRKSMEPPPKQQTHHNQPQADKSRRPSASGPAPGAPRKASGGTTASKIPDARSRTQSRTRQRVASRGQTSSASGERPSAMADAIPHWAQPKPPPTGNWDDVVLPTVAKKMGLNSSADTEITMLGSDSRAANGKQKAEQDFEPAPGTYAYDASKYRSPSAGGGAAGMDEFGGRPHTGEGRRSDQSSPRPASPPPFAAYMPKSPDDYLPVSRPSKDENSEAAGDATPVTIQEPLRGRQPSKKVKPSIMVTSPSDVGAPSKTVKAKGDDDDAGCCKCVIM